jgi:hypothetical protein
MTALYHARKTDKERKFIRLNLVAVRELLPEFEIEHFDGIDATARRFLEKRFERYQRLGGTVQMAFGGWEKPGGTPPRIDHLPTKPAIAKAIAALPIRR